VGIRVLLSFIAVVHKPHWNTLPGNGVFFIPGCLFWLLFRQVKSDKKMNDETTDEMP
jgi:hypothetical protein